MEIGHLYMVLFLIFQYLVLIQIKNRYPKIIREVGGTIWIPFIGFMIIPFFIMLVAPLFIMYYFLGTVQKYLDKN